MSVSMEEINDNDEMLDNDKLHNTSSYLFCIIICTKLSPVFIVLFCCYVGCP